MMPGWWFVLLALRVTWTLYGQTGYIHPDEFFQSTEVLAGDILGLEAYHPWEFNSTFPLRSSVLPCVVYGPALYLLRIARDWLGPPILTSHMLLILPRVTVTLLSGLVDVLIYRLSESPGLLLFCTSYLTFVHYTRTLSNTLEAFLFMVLLYLVISDKNAQASTFGVKALRALSEQVQNQELLEESDEDGERPWNRQRAEPKKSAQTKKKQPQHLRSRKKETRGEQKKQVTSQEKHTSFEREGSETHPRSRRVRPPDTLDLSLDATCEVTTQMSHVLQLAFVLVAGTFNRPTFLLFAAVPYGAWVMSRCNSHRHHLATHAVERLLISALVSAALAVVFVLADSLYYGSLAPRALVGLHRKFLVPREAAEFAASLTITPLNFIRYNVNSTNLAEHGLHPRYRHLLVNAPVVFGLPAFFALYSAVRTAESLVRSSGWRGKSRWGTSNSTHRLLLLTYFTPLALLSLFPHQEERFLIPLLAPLTLLFGQRVFGWTAWRPWTWMWLAPNVLLALVYGVLQQGGLLPCLAHLQAAQSSASPTSSGASLVPTRHLVFYHTYMPPRHLLVLNKGDDIRERTLVHDLQGAPFNHLEALLDKITTTPTERDTISIVSPATLDHQFCSGYKKMTFNLTKVFPWHLSMEDPPNLPGDVTCSHGNFTSCNRQCAELSIFQRLERTLSLNLYKLSSIPK